MPRSSWRVRITALALSVAAHALALLILSSVGREHGPRPAPPSAAAGMPVFLVRLEGAAPARRPARPVEREVWVDVEPRVRPPSVPVAGAPGTAGKGAAGPGAPARSSPGNGGEGGPAKPGLLAVPRTARSVVFVVDRSISMGLSEALERARREVATCLRALAPDVRFQVIAYNRLAEPLRLAGRSDLALAEADLVEEAIRQLRALPASGATDHVGALRRALLLRPDLLYLLTDADDLDHSGVRLLTAINGGRTAIHVVELNAGRTEADLLRKLAGDNRGTYRRVAERR